MYGGIVGYLENNNSSINECYNKAGGLGVHGKYQFCGGIVGLSTGSVENSYNLTSVQGAGYCGGIAGSNSGGPIRNLYNRGKITGQHEVGGISGDIWAASCNNFINIGNIDKNANSVNVNDVCGNLRDSVTWEKGTWMESTNTTATIMGKWSEQEIKNYLGDKFTKDTKGINGGLPILAWQAQ